MRRRDPAVAGLFYPADPHACRTDAEQCFAAARQTAGANDNPILGGVVPHAGWVYSGAIAAHTIAAARRQPAIETFVVFGAMHRVRSRTAVLYASGSWHTPLGAIEIDEELARAVLSASPLIIDDETAHESEHSIEVEVPLLQMIAPAARLLPILVPPGPAAADIGRIVAEQVRTLRRRTLFLGSSDLTHYGPRYGFTPAGAGAEGLRWAKDVNDRRLLDLLEILDAEQVVDEAHTHHNACGSGAIAATVAACRHLGATRGQVLRHVSSAEVLGPRGHDMLDAVDYASVVFV